MASVVTQVSWFFFRVVVVVILPLLAGCATAPLQPPPDDPNPVLLPVTPFSEIQVPVSLNLLKLRADMLQQLPKPLLSGQVNSAFNFPGVLAMKAQAVTKYQMTVDDLDLKIIKQHFIANITASFAVQSQLQGPLGQMGLLSCGVNEPQPRVAMAVEGDIVAGVNGLVVSPGDWKLHWLQPCRLTALHVDLGALLDMPVIRDKVRAAVQDALQQGLGQGGLRTALAGVWPTLNQPVDLGHGLWLLLHPQAMAVNGMEGHGYLLAMNMQLKARPEVLGDRPAVQPVPALPDLKPWSAAPGFHLLLSIDLPLTRANELINMSVAGHAMPVNGHTVLIRQIQFYGHQDKAVLGLTLEQPLAAQIYVEATPVFDATKGEMYFQNLDYALSTSSMLARSASWMLGNSFRQQLMQRLHIPYSQAVQQMQRYTHAPIPLGHGLIAHLSMQHFQPMGLWLTKTSVHTVLQADGALLLSYGTL